MVNCTNPMECNYNITRLLDSNTNIVTDPATWLYIFDSVAGGFMMVGILAVIGLVAFILMNRQIDDTLDSLMYASFMCTILGVLMFLVPMSIAGAKLLTWSRIIPFFVILLITIFVRKSNLQY